MLDCGRHVGSYFSLWGTLDSVLGENGNKFGDYVEGNLVRMSIVTTHPEIAKQWHPTKNGDLKPENITSGSGIPLWWLCINKCDYGCLHEWKAPMYSRKGGGGCPFCSLPKKTFCFHESIKYTHPEIALQWHPTKNGDLKPENFSKGSDEKIWWFCENTCPEGCKHEYESAISNRTGIKNMGCIYCSNHSPKNLCIHTSFVTTHPEIADEWHPTKNGDLKPEDYLSGSGVSVWWLCKNITVCGCPREWKAAIGDRCNRRGCPYCSSPKKKICIHESIAYTHPEVASQWHPTKNGDLKPENYSKGSNEVIWWLCPNKCEYGCPHEWRATINTRCQDHGCPFCDGKKAHCYHNSIEFNYPQMCNEIHTTKNEDIGLIKSLTGGSNKKVWWICSKNTTHEWKTVIANRCLSGNGCPFCKNKTERKLLEFLTTYYPDIFTELKFDSCKNILRLPFDFCIPSLKVIIELDGRQHFKHIKLFKNNVDDSIHRDIYKMQRAEAEGYKVIRIFQEDVYDNPEKWLEENLLPEIKSEDRNHAFISAIPNMYDAHKELYNRKLQLCVNRSDII